MIKHSSELILFTRSYSYIMMHLNQINQLYTELLSNNSLLDASFAFVNSPAAGRLL